MKGDREKYLDAGMSDYLSKPINPTNLFSMLAKWAAKIQSDDHHTIDQVEANIGEHPIFDKEVLAELIEAVGDDVADKLVAIGIADMHDRIARMVALRQQSDIKAIQELAHDVKSAAGSLGAMRLYNLTSKLDMSCRENRVDDALAMLDEIESVAEGAFFVMQAHLDGQLTGATNYVVNE